MRQNLIEDQTNNNNKREIGISLLVGKMVKNQVVFPEELQRKVKNLHKDSTMIKKIRKNHKMIMIGELVEVDLIIIINIIKNYHIIKIIIPKLI